MPERYLLPCQCGRTTPVESRQAGQAVECGCGRSLTVPTLIELKRLDPAPADRTAVIERRSNWGAAHRVAVVGILVFSAALVGGGVQLYYWPAPPYSRIDVEQMQRAVAQFSPGQAWAFWDRLRETGLSPIHPGQQEAYEKALVRAQIALGAAALAAVLGAALLLLAAWLSYIARKQPVD